MSKSVRLAGAAMLLALAVLPLAACGSDVTAPTNPATTTQTFTGTLNANGGITYSFTVGTSGSVTATLTTLDPAGAVTVGLLLGSYSSVTSSCSVAVSNDLAVQGTVVTASASSATTACVRIYDALGTVTAATAFTITVVHPT